MKMRSFWIRSAAVALIFILMLNTCIYAAAEEFKEYEERPQAAEYTQSGDLVTKKVDIKTPVGATLKSLVGAVSLPSSYSNNALVERVENQNPHGLCWSFVQNTLAAINVKKDEGKSVNYSEIHMGYSLSDENNNALGFNRSPNGGGNSDMSVAYMARGSGLVQESDDPFIATKPLPARAASVTDSFFSTGYLEEAPMMRDCTLTQMKELIYQYGGAGVSIYYHDDYYNFSTNTYYCGVDADSDLEDGVVHNHAITLIGWDDSRQCFLALNSWGSGWGGNNGRFWLSYHDKQVRDYVFATDYKSGDLPYDGLRNYSNYGWNSWMESYTGEAVYFGTTYDTDDATALEGIGTYTLSPNTKLEIYVNPYNGDGKASTFTKVHSQTFEKPGYYHISFNEPVSLYGSKFNVKIKASSATGATACAPLEMNYPNGLQNCTLQKGRTYFGRSGSGMRLLEEIYDSTWLNDSGWTWSMQAYTKSDLAFEMDQAKIAFNGETYQVTLSAESDRTYSLTRNGKKLPLYGNSACTAEYKWSNLSTGNYYIKLENGTHIRRKITITQSNIYPEGEAYTVNSVGLRDGIFSIHMAGNTFTPNVITSEENRWSISVLPGGVGPIGSSFTPKLYRSKLYLQVVATDNIAVREYPIILYRPTTFSVYGYTDWAQVSSWAKKSMNKMVSYGYITGSGGKLNPKGTMSRAEAATFLLRAAGIDSKKVGTEYAKCFADIKSSDWYADEVSTAAMIGMVDGHSNSGYRAFSPKGTVTREQFAAMMIRLIAYTEGVDTSTYINRYLDAAKQFAASKGFPDYNSVSSWAKKSVYVALYLGVFEGAGSGNKLYIQPKREITRQEAAKMMNSSMDLIK